MATLIKRGKIWTVKYYDAAGRQRWVKGFTDKAESQRLANRLEDEKVKMQRGDIDPQHEARKIERAKDISIHIDAYKAHLQAKGSSTNHVAYTIADIKALVEFAHINNAAAITWNMIDSWVLSLKSGEKPDSPRTVNRRVGSVQAFLRHLHRQGGVSQYVLEKYPKQQVKGHEKRHRRALSKEECTKLLAAAPESRRLIYQFALQTGFRYAEVASMTPASFNFPSRTITVRANDAKNKSKDQSVPMHKDLVKPLTELCNGKERTDRVFTMPAQSEAAKLIRQDCRSAGVDDTHVDFHALRHSFITQLAEQLIHPKILQELARHSSIETTLRYYVHFRQDSERTAIDQL